MLQTNNKYLVNKIDDYTLYIVPNFELCEVKDIISDILRENDSILYKYIITSANGDVVYERGVVNYFTTITPKTIPFFLVSDEFIDNILSRQSLAKIRKSAKITQKELSEISGLSSQCISNLESDDPKQSPTLRTVLRYLNCLGYDINFTKKK